MIFFCFSQSSAQFYKLLCQNLPTAATICDTCTGHIVNKVISATKVYMQCHLYDQICHDHSAIHLQSLCLVPFAEPVLRFICPSLCLVPFAEPVLCFICPSVYLVLFAEPVPRSSAKRVPRDQSVCASDRLVKCFSAELLGCVSNDNYGSPYPAKVIYLSCQPLNAVSRYRDPQASQIFMFKSHFILNNSGLVDMEDTSLDQ